MTTSPIDRARQYQDELTAIRRDIHAHPELGLEEYRTADLVAQKLEEWGIRMENYPSSSWVHIDLKPVPKGGNRYFKV